MFPIRRPNPLGELLAARAVLIHLAHRALKAAPPKVGKAHG